MACRGLVYCSCHHVMLTGSLVIQRECGRHPECDPANQGHAYTPQWALRFCTCACPQISCTILPEAAHKCNLMFKIAHHAHGHAVSITECACLHAYIFTPVHASMVTFTPFQCAGCACLHAQSPGASVSAPWPVPGLCSCRNTVYCNQKVSPAHSQ